MTLALVGLMVFTGWIFVRRSWRKTGMGLGLLGMCWLLAAGTGLATGPLLAGLQGRVSIDMRGDWTERSAIVVLGVGLAEGMRGSEREVPVWGFGRLVRVMELYRECAASRDDCQVVVSGGMGREGNREADAYGEALQKMGLPEQALKYERASMNTWENARYTATLLRGEGRTEPVLVTSALHVRRALEYFGAFGLDADAVASDFLEPELSWYPTALNVAMADLALHEYLGIVRFHVYEALDVNK